VPPRSQSVSHSPRAARSCAWDSTQLSGPGSDRDVSGVGATLGGACRTTAGRGAPSFLSSRARLAGAAGAGAGVTPTPGAAGSGGGGAAGTAGGGVAATRD
jgi:hypothetical protein